MPRVDLPLTLNWQKIRSEHAPLLGEKCYKLAFHKQKGQPVPPFFAIPNSEVRKILEKGKMSLKLQNSIMKEVRTLEKETNSKFGSEENPLLLVVRSGDPRSMYGALLTINSIGLNDQTYRGLIKKYGPESEANVLWLYLDLIVDFARQVRGIEKNKIQSFLSKMRGLAEVGNKINMAMNAAQAFSKFSLPTEVQILLNEIKPQLQALIEEAKSLERYYLVEFTFPQEVREQLMQAILAVVFSWNSLKARCAAAAVGLGPNELPSVFVQQMKFSSLTPDSAFISLLSNPGPYGHFAPQTTGRRVMFGLATAVDKFENLARVNQGMYQKIISLVDEIVREEKRPLNLEIIVEKGSPNIVQISEAALSPTVYIEAVNDMASKGIISGVEATRRRAEVQRENKIKMFKLNPEAHFELVAKGKPGAPGAIQGEIALTAKQALDFKKENKKVILVSGEPQDEGVYLLTLGKGIDGIIATYGIGQGSHIADFAQANGIPMVASLKEIEFSEEKVRIGEKWFRVGDPVIINGSSGEIYLSQDPNPFIEGEDIVRLSYGINYLELLRSMRNRYQASTYEEILAEHARGVREIEGWKFKEAREQEIEGIQARIHCLHLLAYEKGKELGKSRIEVDLDVAVADGNLNRVPGLEGTGFYLREEDDSYIIIVGMDEYWDYYGGRTVGITDIKKISDLAQKEGLSFSYYCKQEKITQHTQYVTAYGIKFPKKDLLKVLDFLKRHLSSFDFSNEIIWAGER